MLTPGLIQVASVRLLCEVVRRCDGCDRDDQAVKFVIQGTQVLALFWYARRRGL